MRRSNDQGRLLIGNAEFFLFGAVGTFLLPFYYLSFHVNHSVAYPGPDPLIATSLFLTIGAIVSTVRWTVLSVTRKTLTIILTAFLLAWDWMCVVVFVRDHVTLSLFIGLGLAVAATMATLLARRCFVFGVAVWGSAIVWSRMIWGLMANKHWIL